MRALTVVAIAATAVLGQDYTEDSMAVRAILDTNGWAATEVDEVAVDSGGRIVTLDLHARELRMLPPTVATLDGLRRLDLTGCSLTALPEQVAELRHLRKLRVGGNPLGVLPAWIDQLDSLEELDARLCGLVELPEEIGRVSNLRSLILQRNRLTSLPDSMALLTRLSYLDLTGNLLESMPESMGRMLLLNEIYLANNRFKRLPQCLTRMAGLVFVFADSNALETLPVDIGNLELGTLSLNSNELAQLPGSIRKLSGLFFFIDDNRLCSLPDSVEAWLDQTTSDLWDWRTTQRCPQSAATSPAMPPALSREFSVVSQGASNYGRIEYRVTAPGAVRIELWNASGGLVCVPVDRYHVPGTYAVLLTGTRLAGGTYVLRMVNGSRQILAMQLIAR
jgi:hypothetical protein